MRTYVFNARGLLVSLAWGLSALVCFGALVCILGFYEMSARTVSEGLSVGQQFRPPGTLEVLVPCSVCLFLVACVMLSQFTNVLRRYRRWRGSELRLRPDGLEEQRGQTHLLHSWRDLRQELEIRGVRGIFLRDEGVRLPIAWLKNAAAFRQEWEEQAQCKFDATGYLRR